MNYSFFNLFQSRSKVREAVVQTREATDTATTATAASGSYMEKVQTVTLPTTALTISAVYRAVELRAKTEAQFVAQYQKMNFPGGNYVPDYRGYGRKYNYLMGVQPNPTMTAAGMWEQIVIQKLLKGNAVVYIERDEFDLPKYFWLASSVTFDAYNGIYHLQYMSDHGLVYKSNVPRTDVLHFLNTFRTDNGLWGISTIRYAIDSMSLTKTVSSQALESAAKGGRVKLLVGEDAPQGGGGLLAGGLYTPEATKKYAKELSRDIYSQDVVAMRGFSKAQSLSMTAQEMQMIELLGMGMDDVARYFGTPRALLMLDSNSHYTTPQATTVEFLTRTIQPDINEHEQELQRKLIDERHYTINRWHLCEQPLLRLDKEAQAKVDEINLRTGAASVNEIRQQYDRPAVKDGDKIYILANLAELGSDKLRSTGGTPATPQEGEKGEDS